VIVVPKDLPQAPPEVFVLATPDHVLGKLYWEYYSFKKSLTDKSRPIGHTHAPSYHAFNFSVTAWHLADWVWEDLGDERRAYIAERFNREITRKSDLQRILAGNCRELHICRQIANGSKHKKLSSKSIDPSVRVGIEWKQTARGAGELTAGAPLADFSYDLFINDQGTSRPAVEVFKIVRNYWHDQLSDWGFCEGRHFGMGEDGVDD
jgi:hypothetical protein